MQGGVSDPLQTGHVDSASDRFLNIYFLAQDIHERVSSSHYRYQELADHFGRSDILFRFKYLLETQAKACRDIAQSIRLGHSYQHDSASIVALDELQLSLSYLRQQERRDWKSLLGQLGYLFNNLATVEKQLNNVSNPDVAKPEEGVLDDTEAHTLGSMWQRIRANLNKDSLLFRHALRLSITLTLAMRSSKGSALSAVTGFCSPPCLFASQTTPQPSKNSPRES